MKALSQTAYAMVAAAAVLQLIGMSAARASERTKPYLTADAQGATPLAHPSEPDLSAPAQPVVGNVGTEQLEKLLLHSALTGSSAFGLLQALQQPAKAVPTATPSTSASEPARGCAEASRKRT